MQSATVGPRARFYDKNHFLENFFLEIDLHFIKAFSSWIAKIETIKNYMI